MVNNETLRERARFQLGNQIFANPWVYMVLVYMIYSAIMSVAGSASLGILAFIVGGPLIYSFYGITLSCARGLKWKIEDLFSGFSKYFAESLMLYLLLNLFIFLWTLLFIIPGIVKSYAYSMSYYIANDNPTLGAKECLDESQKLMDGHKWQLFCLDVSFIGWYFVGALCFGIGTLFVVPYHQVARANFYAELRMEKDMAQSVNMPPKQDCFEEFNA